MRSDDFPCVMSGRQLATAVVVAVLSAASSVHGRTWYVDPSSKHPHDGTSWRRAYTELQEALAVAAANDQIWVAQGTYRPDYDPATGVHTANRSASFMLIYGKMLYGGFPPGGGDGTFSARNPEVYETVLNGDLLGDDVSPLADALICWSGDGHPYQEGCGSYDADADNDVDDADLHIADNCYQVVNVGFAGSTVDGLTITAGHVSSASSESSGGGIVCSGNLTLTNCRLVANSAVGSVTSDGGAIDIRGQLSLNMTGCQFLGNFAHQKGGAIAARGSTTIQATSCEFLNNRIKNDDGGAIYKYDHCNGTFTDCRFIGNTSGYYGAAIYSWQANSTRLTNCYFDSNRSYACGGAISLADTRADISGCTFSNNACSNAGGAVYGSNLHLSQCTLVGNHAGESSGNGGAVCGSNLYLSHCTLVDNHAGEPLGGGGAIDADEVLSLRDCDLIRNTAGHGGAVYTRLLPDLDVTRCRFLGNAAAVSGGAFEGTLDSSTISNCVFVGNRAGTYGGAIVTLSEGYFTSCSFVANTAGTNGGGLYNTYDYPPSLYNCIFWANADSTGAKRSSQFTNAPSVWRQLSAYYCCVQYGIPGTDLTAPPDFVANPAPGADGVWGTTDDDYGDLQLQTGSPCIDAGTNSASHVGTDLAGRPRKVDDGAKPDTGNGTPPIIDIGAYEAPGDCNGNGVPDETEADTDHDGYIDQCETCPADPAKHEPGLCGCGVPDTDSDGEGVPDCHDNCPNEPNLDQGDADEDGVGDACDDCPNTIPWATVDATGCPPVIPGDFDRDGDVDGDDVNAFKACTSGPAIPLTSGCESKDLDHDDDVDQSDFGIFQCCYSGENNPANPSCAN